MFRLAPLLILLAACSSTLGPVRYEMPLPPPGERVPVNVGALEVRDAQLPLYAELEEIYTEGEGGALVSDTDVLWADDPRRAVTQGLALALARMTTAQVATEPWPLSDLPDARLDVRLDRVLAGADGVFRLSGQYFLSRDTGAERSDLFDIRVPYEVGSTQAVAAAKGAAVAELARSIARDALGGRGV
ncbi:PqiC family protein [Roseitranquillus sediminis]|uniref:PqiC family protein n=1 Tax=Roseitranquillus sediminis TaxID=2809051 RepID=UPI001D0BF558|nr:ABC-type transport auxiliary lipoprotein family protein [Roseitranquillus sediminis]MBM9593449.1 membrane integrity-associated transporter subunit PqiC [Roseitranquillus sediminis]